MGALTAAATGVAALTKKSIEGYAEYEQLVGGVETLFGAGGKSLEEYAASVGKTVSDAKAEYDKLIASQNAVIDNASNAYKTAGLSANQYMETVTSFSASLLQSLGGNTEAAAKYADAAITDMADNANKMGTSIEMIQNAYQGFAKRNYTMLDNLKLGYGGTEDEMERLIADANRVKEANGEVADLSIDSFADIVEAIHTVQEEMGIAGATAEEAEGTISGSIYAMKSAWTNLVTGIADENADMDGLIGNFINSAVIAADNLLDRVNVVLTGIGTAVEKIAPVIIEKLPEVVTTVLPGLIESGGELVMGLIFGITEAFPQLVNVAMNVVDKLFYGLKDGLPMILESGVDILLTLVDGITKAVPDMIAELPNIITSLVVFLAENLPKLVKAGGELLGGIAKGLVMAIPELIKNLPTLIMSISQGIIDLTWSIMNVGVDIVKGIWEGIKSMASWIKEKVGGFFTGIVDGVKDFLGIHSPSRVFASIGENMALGLGDGWDNEYGKIKRDIENGMDFGTASVGFESSSMNRGLKSAMTAPSFGGRDIVFNITETIDGRVLSRNQYKYNAQEDTLRGSSLVEGVT